MLRISLGGRGKDSWDSFCLDHFPPARHLPAMLRNARRAGREALRPALQPSGVRRMGEADGDERQKCSEFDAVVFSCTEITLRNINRAKQVIQSLRDSIQRGFAA